MDTMLMHMVICFRAPMFVLRYIFTFAIIRSSMIINFITGVWLCVWCRMIGRLSDKSITRRSGINDIGINNMAHAWGHLIPLRLFKHSCHALPIDIKVTKRCYTNSTRVPFSSREQ